MLDMFFIAITYLSIFVAIASGLEPVKIWQGTSSHGGHRTYRNSDSQIVHQNVDSYGNPIAPYKHTFNALSTHENDWEQYNNHLDLPQNLEVSKSVPFTGNAGYSQPIRIAPVYQPIGVPVIRTIFVPAEKKIPYAIEKIVPVPVEKPIQVTVEKHIPVPVEKPYPIHIPVYKHIFHRMGRGQEPAYTRRRRYHRP